MHTDDEIVEIGARGMFDALHWMNGLTERDRKVVRSQFRCALAALREAGLVLEQDWQPIETAPTAERIWLYVPSFPAPANKMMVGLRYPDENAWFVQHPSVHTVGGDSPNQPTHWRPLPAPPATGGENA